MRTGTAISMYQIVEHGGRPHSVTHISDVWILGTFDMGSMLMRRILGVQTYPAYTYHRRYRDCGRYDKGRSLQTRGVVTRTRSRHPTGWRTHDVDPKCDDHVRIAHRPPTYACWPSYVSVTASVYDASIYCRHYHRFRHLIPTLHDVH